MKLLIVESPIKAKTIESYLNNEYRVISTKGAIRDLKTTGFGGYGVDIKNNFMPQYTLLEDKKALVKELIKLAQNAEQVIIATDPDREGEAIAWHVLKVLGLKETDLNRVTFNEITKSKIQNEINHPRIIDLNLVHSQEARRVIDRIIGFSLSGLVQRKIGSRSAGRVQSVALKLVVDLEKKILAFIPTPYYLVQLVKYNADNETPLFKGDYLNIKTMDIKSDDVVKIKAEATSPFTVTKREEKITSSRLKSPFTTSLIQQEAFNKFAYSAKRTMSILQSLFEGININNELVGLITYLRTDSKRLAPDFVANAQTLIKNNWGQDYVGSIIKSNTDAKIQDAHEAIRPTNLSLTPAIIQDYLKPEEYKLYKLIYERTLSALMAPGQIKTITYTLSSHGHDFRVDSKEVVFKGNLLFDKREDTTLPVYQVGDMINDCNLLIEEKETLPPARYTEASLIKTLEEKGIGRPSTYATIMQALKNRDYVNVVNKAFIPTEQGILTIDQLSNYFASIINEEYTSHLEMGLDMIAENRENYLHYVDTFYQKYNAIYQEAQTKMTKVVVKIPDRICPDCGGELLYRNSRYGRFIGCNNFPECKFVEAIKREYPKKKFFRRKNTDNTE